MKVLSLVLTGAWLFYLYTAALGWNVTRRPVAAVCALTVLPMVISDVVGNFLDAKDFPAKPGLTKGLGPLSLGSVVIGMGVLVHYYLVPRLAHVPRVGRKLGRIVGVYMLIVLLTMLPFLFLDGEGLLPVVATLDDPLTRSAIALLAAPLVLELAVKWPIRHAAENMVVAGGDPGPEGVFVWTYPAVVFAASVNRFLVASIPDTKAAMSTAAGQAVVEILMRQSLGWRDEMLQRYVLCKSRAATHARLSSREYNEAKAARVST